MNSPTIVQVEKLVYRGEGLARLNGQIVFVPFVLPGEQVSVRTERVKGGILRGSSPEVLQPASQRITPRCEYFANCGGCHYQHAQYAFELEQKREILRETLLRLGGVKYDNQIEIISGPPWYYRNRIQLHFGNQKSGFHKAESHDLCAINHCEISSPMLNEVIANLQTAVKQSQWPAFLRSLEIFTNEAQIQLNVTDSIRPVAARFFEWCSTFLPPLVANAIEYSAAGYTFRVSRGSFFQVNRFLIDALVQEALGDAEGKYAVDLYAGVGLFSMALAERFQKVDAVEATRAAYRDLERNTLQNRTNLFVANTSAEEFMRNLNGAPVLIVADPPRAGLGREVTNELIRVSAPRLTLISCDPSTLARDLGKLLRSYRIERLTLIDLFPQTYHFETVAQLQRS